MNTDILIVGGGLSGLSIARQLQSLNVDYHLVEARPRLGGRILTQSLDYQGKTGYFDLGPAWFWPGQPRIAQLMKELNLTAFLQYAKGELNFEDEQGQVFRGRGYASMAGSYRLQGGLAKLVDSIAQQLDQTRLSLGLKVVSFEKSTDSILANCVDSQNSRQANINCKRVILALPPRIIADQIAFNPPLPPKAIAQMSKIPTWMAGEAKIVAVYDRPFWKEAGLSGDAMSRLGPMAEIHDASPHHEQLSALFGFVGVPAINRHNNVDQLLQNAQTQLVRLFGKEALNPIELIFQDWSQEPETATKLDFLRQYGHPSYGLPHILTNLWQGKLILSSTEIATSFGGYLEGALEASEMTLKTLLNSLH
ncbi:MAG: FAD-dependent oxidoreductase [Cyanobacteria bacterium J06642_3]